MMDQETNETTQINERKLVLLVNLILTLLFYGLFARVYDLWFKSKYKKVGVLPIRIV